MLERALAGLLSTTCLGGLRGGNVQRVPRGGNVQRVLLPHLVTEVVDGSKLARLLPSVVPVLPTVARRALDRAGDRVDRANDPIAAQMAVGEHLGGHVRAPSKEQALTRLQQTAFEQRPKRDSC